MYRCFATVLLVLSTISITGCDSGGNVIPDENAVPAVSAEDKATQDSYNQSQMDQQKKGQAPQ